MTVFTKSSRNLGARIATLARRMDWTRGLRAAFALCVPLVVGHLAGLSIAGWAALGGFEAILADAGGPYRNRLISLATLSFGGASGFLLGSIIGRSVIWAVPVTAVFCFLWSYFSVLGPPFTTAGLLVQVIYICGIGAPAPDWRTSLLWSFALFVGGVWAALLSLFLWPLDVYRPARIAVAGCYAELASFLGSVYDLVSRDPSTGRTPTPALWHRLAQHHQFRMRRTVEQGWEGVASIRAERHSESPRTHQLVVLLEHADLLLARTIALAEHFEEQARVGNDSACFQRGLSSLSDLRSAEAWIASLLVRRRALTIAHARAKWREMDRLPHYLAGCIDSLDPDGRFLLVQVAESSSILESSVESASLLRLGKTLFDTVPDSSPSTPRPEHIQRLGQFRHRPGLDLLAANLVPGSLILRHALRVAIVCGLNTSLILLFNIDHGYWLLLTSLIVLQPHVSGTLRRGLERVGGTVGGGILAAVLAVALHSQLVIAAVLFPLTVLSIAILPVGYGAYAFFLTPIFLLAWLPYSGDWQFALVRVFNTFAGAIISILAMMFLFPIYERDLAPAFLRASLIADRLYLEQLIQAWKGEHASSRELAIARRRTGLANNDTEESLERLLAEVWPRRLPSATSATAFVTYLRRLAQTITTLTTLTGESDWKQSIQVQNRLKAVQHRICWLERQFDAAPSANPPVWPEQKPDTLPPSAYNEIHPGERLLERLERQAEVLRRQLLAMRDSGLLTKAKATVGGARSPE